MFINFLVLFFLFMLMVLFGWLTYLAVRASKVWVKIAGGLAAGLVTLLLAAVLFMGVRGFISIYFPGADPAPEMTIEGTPEQVARGEYLVNVSCANCHGHVGGEGVPDGHPLTGGWDIGADQGFGFIGKFAAENLTPGGKLAEYSDGEIFRAIRQSVNKKSQRLGFMAFLPYNQLSDEDTKAIVAYLRSLPAEQSTRETGNKPNFVGVLLFGSGMMSFSDIVRGEVTAPAQGATPEYGHYVTIYAECRGCHGQDMRGMPASALGPAVINPRPFVATLTLEQFSEMMRSGIRPDGTAFSPAMPWQNASKLTDEDMAALYNYLVEPVE